MSKHTPARICLYILTRPLWLRLLLAPMLWLARRRVMREAIESEEGMTRLLALMSALDDARRR